VFSPVSQASSGFVVNSVESIVVSIESEGDVKQSTILLVKLISWLSWSDFDIDERLAMILP
jgi:hypothetical protein